jgi:hypothetical protein
MLFFPFEILIFLNKKMVKNCRDQRGALARPGARPGGHDRPGRLQRLPHHQPVKKAMEIRISSLF